MSVYSLPDAMFVVYCTVCLTEVILILKSIIQSSDCGCLLHLLLIRRGYTDLFWAIDIEFSTF